MDIVDKLLNAAKRVDPENKMGLTREEIKKRMTHVPKYWTSDDEFDVQNLPPKTIQLFEEYVGIKREDIRDHILAVRDKAYSIWPYPCIGNFRFLDTCINSNRHVDDIVTTLKEHSDAKFLDLGCCFAQDVRMMIHLGVPSRQCVGVDLRQEFLDAGYALFMDKDRTEAVYFVDDVFNDTGRQESGDCVNSLESLKGELAVVLMGSFLHLFNLEKQKVVLKRVVGLMQPFESRSKTPQYIFGRQMGSRQPGHRESRWGNGDTRFWHDENSFREMWMEIGEETGSGWDVEVEEAKWGIEGIGLSGKSRGTGEEKENERENEVDEEDRIGLMFTVIRAK